MSKNILKSSLENAWLNIFFQIFCRIVTFVLNAFVVRHVGEAVLGVMNVRLLLLESIILFLSREPFFRACLTNTAEHNWAQVVNLLWLAVPLCTVISLIFGYFWLYILSTSEILPAYYDFAVKAVALSCIIHLASLVVQLVSTAFLFNGFKIIVDTSMIVFRTLIFVPMVLYRPDNALLAFGVAQLASHLFYTVVHYSYFYWYINNKLDTSEINKDTNFPFKSVSDFLPGQLNNNGPMLDKQLVILTGSLFRQGFLKQILSEGERMIMTFFPVLTFAQQGAYDVVNNLGSLAARFIFRPIEDSAHFYFTQMVKRNESLTKQKPSTVRESVDVLMYLCAVVTSIGLIVLVFGFSYSSTLLWLYGGEKFTADLPVLLLRAHCLAVLLLGINGVTECYTTATADSGTIDKRSKIMIYESIIFLIASYTLASWLGPVGFILGNCINMTLRIYHSALFINSRHSETNFRPLRGIIPKPLFSTALVVSAPVIYASQIYLFDGGKIRHVLLGGVMLSIVMLAWMREHKELVLLAAQKINKNKIYVVVRKIAIDVYFYSLKFKMFLVFLAPILIYFIFKLFYVK